MAPVASSARLPAALANLLAPRGPGPQPQDDTSSPVAAVARRFHSLPRFDTLTTRASAGDAPSRVLSARQQVTTSTIPGAYPGINAGPDAGTVVGITLGSVAGFLLLLWLVYTCLSMNGGRSRNVDTVSSYGTASVVTRKSRRRHSHHSHRHSHRSPRRETVEVRTSRVFPGVAGSAPAPPPPMGPPPGERVVMEETIRRSSTPAPMPPPGPPPRMVHSDDDDDDEVVVIEEHTPPRRHKSKTHKRRSSSARRESGYRDVDPDRFAGGDTTLRDIRRSSRHGR